MRKAGISLVVTHNRTVFGEEPEIADPLVSFASPVWRAVGRASIAFMLTCLVSVGAPLSASRAGDANSGAFKPNPGTIGLVISAWSDALFETPKATECSLGVQKGDVAQFKAMPGYMEHLKTIGGNYQNRGPHGESPAFNPMLVEDALPFSELTTKVGYGVNLDGTTDGHATPKTCQHEKFTSPEGDKVDDQMARVVGCVQSYRTGGFAIEDHNAEIATSTMNRHLIEITGVDDEKNDPSVDVAIYKGHDRLVRSGDTFIPFQSHRIDERYPNYDLKVHGKIVDGVLITDPIPEARFPLNEDHIAGDREMRNVVLHLKLNDTGAEGIIAGYENTTTWWLAHRNQTITEIGQVSLSGLYRALHRYADGFPDQATGECTFISATYNIKAIRAIIVHAPAHTRVASAQQ